MPNPFVGQLGEAEACTYACELRPDYVLAVEANKSGMMFVLCQTCVEEREVRVACKLLVPYALYRKAVGETEGHTLELRKRTFSDNVVNSVFDMVPHHSTLVTLIGGAVIGGFPGAHGYGPFPALELAKRVGAAERWRRRARLTRAARAAAASPVAFWLNEHGSSLYMLCGHLATNAVRRGEQRLARMRHCVFGCRFDAASGRVVAGGAAPCDCERLVELQVQRDVSAAVLFAFVFLAYQLGGQRPSRLVASSMRERNN